MSRQCASVALLLVLFACLPVTADDPPESASYQLRTWSVVSGAQDGGPVVASASYRLRPRIGDAFSGSAESSSYALWVGGTDSPVEAAFYASTTEPLCVTLRWIASSLDLVAGFNVYRATAEAGPFERINPEVVPAESPGTYEDRDVAPQTEYWYQLWVVEVSGEDYCASPFPAFAATGGRYVTRLHAFTQSPFRDETTVVFEIGSVFGPVGVTMYDISGRLVRTLVSESLPLGRYEVIWDGRNEAGHRLASGVYFCRLEAGDRSESASVVLLK